MTTPEPQTSVGVVLFDGFELLDVFGPLEMYGVLPNRFTIQLVGPTAGTVASAQGPRSVADHAYADAPSCDVLLVPGGIGNRPLLEDRAFLDWLAAPSRPRDWSRRSARAPRCSRPPVCSMVPCDHQQAGLHVGTRARDGRSVAAAGPVGRGRQPLDVIRSCRGDRHDPGDHRVAARP